jgi:cyclopropane fatty-acyl-phospholipid synthase-like methyltransferase
MNYTIEYYKKNARLLAKRYESANVSKVQKLLLEVFPKKSYLLEIGCGSGRDASFMIDNNYKILGIDASREMIDEAKNIHPLLDNLLQVAIIPNELSFDNNSFDGIYSIATLMHLEKDDIEITINKIYSYLKAKGIFLFSVSIQRDDIDSNHKDIKGRHFTTINQDDWLHICHTTGFKTIRTTTTNDGLNRDGIFWLTCIMEK